MPELLSNNAPKGDPGSASDVLDLLNSEETETEVEDKPVKKETKNTTIELEEEEVEEVETPKKGTIDLSEDEDDVEAEEEDSDDIKIEAPPRKQELLKEFPKLFTKFPWLEKMMFRDRQYSELFGSIDDAKEVLDRMQGYDAFEQDLIAGNTEKVLKSVKDLDPKAWDKIVDNYLPTLAKVDKEAYIDVIENIGKHFIKNIYETGKRNGDEELQHLAAGLNKYLFQNTTLEPPKVRSKENPQSDELENERRSFNQERLMTAQRELGGKIENVLKTTISEYIDPKGEMSAYVKKNAVRDCLNLLHGTIGQDQTFVRSLNKLWEEAFRDKFSQNSLGRIRATYLGRSKRELGAIIKRVRAEAQKDSSTRKQIVGDEEETTPRKVNRGPVSAGNPRQSSGKNEMKKGESVHDFFMRD